MEFWTILWITFLGGPFDGERTFLAYPSLQDCLAATSAVSQTLNYDHNLSCEESTTPSKSFPPKPRPEGLTQ